MGYGEGYLGTYRGNADTVKPLPTVARAGVLSRQAMSDRRRFLKGLTSLPLATVLANPAECTVPDDFEVLT